MAAFEEVADENVVRSMVQTGSSHEQVAQYYQNIYHNQRGFSARSVRRYCNHHNINRITDQELFVLVGDLVGAYGHTYGRRMMQGSVRSILGITSGAVSQRRVARALQAVAPREYQARARDLIVRTNPVPYIAPYFGYKAHFDQNEKIVMYGCTHVIMVDGCSRFIVGYAAMPIKNPIAIYELIFRPAMLKYGVWDQVRMDHGQEFCLVSFVQNIISHLRSNQDRDPFKKTPSTSNYVVERFWPEVNSRVNYPIKRAINILIEQEEFDLEDPVFKYCLSRITLFISFDAVQHFINSWNRHRIPGRRGGRRGCVPLECMVSTSRTARPPSFLIPTVSESIEMYEINGGNLTRVSEFGTDPLSNNFPISCTATRIYCDVAWLLSLI